MSDKTQLSTEYTPEKRNRKKVLAIILVVSIVIISATVGLGYTFSRYASSLDDDYHYIDAQDFYFSAEYLVLYTGNDAEIPTYTLYNYPANNSITFNVYNYVDDQSINAEAITFTTHTTGGTITSGGTIATGGQNSFPVTLTASAATEYTVSVSSTSPYIQTLKAKFRFVDAAAPTVNCNLVNYDDYVMLNVAVSSHGEENCSVNLKWDADNYTLDTLNGLFPSGSAITNPDTVNLKTGGSYQFIFYKKNVFAATASNLVDSADSVTAGSKNIYIGLVE